jgi:hypothetical protein
MGDRAEHSPAPWIEDEVCIVGGDGKAVCSLCKDDEYWGIDNDDVPDTERARIVANSRIICAAPELLEALRSIGEYLGEGPPSTRWKAIVKECGDIARAAIAKATDQS